MLPTPIVLAPVVLPTTMAPTAASALDTVALAVVSDEAAAGVAPVAPLVAGSSTDATSTCMSYIHPMPDILMYILATTRRFPLSPEELLASLELRPNPPGASWYLVTAGTEPGIYLNLYVEN